MSSFPVPDLTKVDEAFPAHATEWMPSIDEVPEEFVKGKTQWNRIVESWFIHGLPNNAAFYPADGVDAEKAYNAAQAALRSYAFPKHQEKEAIVAYALSLWFKKIEKWRHDD